MLHGSFEGIVRVLIMFQGDCVLPLPHVQISIGVIGGGYAALRVRLREEFQRVIKKHKGLVGSPALHKRARLLQVLRGLRCVAAALLFS